VYRTTILWNKPYYPHSAKLPDISISTSISTKVFNYSSNSEEIPISNLYDKIIVYLY